MRVRNILTNEVREARWTTDRAASSYGVPVLVLDDGEALEDLWWEPLKPGTRLHGDDAIDCAEREGLTLCKYADRIEDAREGLTVEEARAVATEDPNLIYFDL